MKLALLGYGKMGKTIERLAKEMGHEIVYKKGSSLEEGTLTRAEAAIEFSIPEAAVTNIAHCLEKNIPVVSGTTGWLSEYDDMVQLCKKCNGSFIYASNFSIGVNLFFSINEYAAKIMAPWKEYSAGIEEIHHTQKLDAPSGTAITIAEGIIQHSEKKSWTMETPQDNEIKIEAVREGDVKGTHTVAYVSAIDTISLTHKAHTRDGFAKGAILAAQWLKNKKGVFTMKDVLGI
ncbi:4-hydroxy-tetrahydrodipicolinate reductase [Marinirhabdus gelatinilytica]|uniref:4-hydroxy-tetrahydrodipicolinate reductase n=1 Tax=Marinirhabdus gelatinilytica TaxID=1703343 RepID=A0A370QGP4_9FLAO|nr:4-hydroxy-tetrahydrodipicolinate reductase [Marinirhabdus gelatinilytica]RDK87250.1 dihydrodipicolinate reductase [Marinirhabdus gelatinilytica]